MTDDPPTERVVAYIDGFTVYYGLIEKGWRHLLWLDYVELLRRSLRPHQQLVGVKYFTSRVTKPADRRARQAVYLDALTVNGGLEIVEGKYEVRPHRCPDCGHKWDKPKEKMTDVNIATVMAMDALDDVYDLAVLLAADADLVPAVRLVKKRFGKTVFVLCPRGRRSDELNREASTVLYINRAKLNQSQLPDDVGSGSQTYSRPPEWS